MKDPRRIRVAELNAGWNLTDDEDLAALTLPASWYDGRPTGVYFAEIICAMPIGATAGPLDDRLGRVSRPIFRDALEYLGRCGEKVGEHVWRGEMWEVWQRRRAGKRHQVGDGLIRSEVSPLFRGLHVGIASVGRTRYDVIASSRGPSTFEICCPNPEHVMVFEWSQWKKTRMPPSLPAGSVPIITIAPDSALRKAS